MDFIALLCNNRKPQVRIRTVCVSTAKKKKKSRRVPSWYRNERTLALLHERAKVSCAHSTSWNVRTQEHNAARREGRKEGELRRSTRKPWVTLCQKLMRSWLATRFFFECVQWREKRERRRRGGLQGGDFGNAVKETFTYTCLLNVFQRNYESARVNFVQFSSTTSFEELRKRKRCVLRAYICIFST